MPGSGQTSLGTQSSSQLFSVPIKDEWTIKGRHALEESQYHEMQKSDSEETDTIKSRRKLFNILRKISKNTSSMKQYLISVKNKTREKCWFTNWSPCTKSKERSKGEADHCILMGGKFSKQVNL